MMFTPVSDVPMPMQLQRLVESYDMTTTYRNVQRGNFAIKIQHISSTTEGRRTIVGEIFDPGFKHSSFMTGEKGTHKWNGFLGQQIQIDVPDSAMQRLGRCSEFYAHNASVEMTPITRSFSG